jgi:hypothetical protein
MLTVAEIGRFVQFGVRAVFRFFLFLSIPRGLSAV